MKTPSKSALASAAIVIAATFGAPVQAVAATGDGAYSTYSNHRCVVHDGHKSTPDHKATPEWGSHNPNSRANGPGSSAKAAC